jgi:hypothetical protein
MSPLHIPTKAGPNALDELPSVPWASLTHAFAGRSVRNPFTGLYTKTPDIDVFLGDIANPDDEIRAEAFEELAGCLYHQGDLYEATVYAVPFLCALAVDPPHDIERELLLFLVIVGEASAFAKNASFSTRVLEAFRQSAAHVGRLAARPGFPNARRFLSDLAHDRAPEAPDMAEFDGA